MKHTWIGIANDERKEQDDFEYKCTRCGEVAVQGVWERFPEGECKMTTEKDPQLGVMSESTRTSIRERVWADDGMQTSMGFPVKTDAEMLTGTMRWLKGKENPQVVLEVIRGARGR